MTRARIQTIGDIIRAGRQEIRFTQSDFADELGVSRRTLTRWETNDIVPHEEHFPFIAKVFYSFDRALGERVAKDLGLEEIPGTFGVFIDGPIAEAAKSLGVSESRMRKAVAEIVNRWRLHDATFEEVSRHLKA